LLIGQKRVVLYFPCDSPRNCFHFTYSREILKNCISTRWFPLTVTGKTRWFPLTVRNICMTLLHFPDVYASYHSFERVILFIHLFLVNTTDMLVILSLLRGRWDVTFRSGFLFIRLVPFIPALFHSIHLNWNDRSLFSEAYSVYICGCITEWQLLGPLIL